MGRKSLDWPKLCHIPCRIEITGLSAVPCPDFCGICPWNFDSEQCHKPIPDVRHQKWINRFLTHPVWRQRANSFFKIIFQHEFQIRNEVPECPRFIASWIISAVSRMNSMERSINFPLTHSKMTHQL